MILDTSFLVDVMRGDQAALSKVDEIEDAGVEQLVPAMTLQELYIGVGASDLPKRDRRLVERVLSARPFVPTDEEIARKAGLIDGRLRAGGLRNNVGDAAVGATGIVVNQPVLTGDPEHVERIPGLEVEHH